MLLQRVRSALLAGLVAAGLSACDGVQHLLDQLAGKPNPDNSSENVSQPDIDVPAGAQLYCISNIGHTLVVFDLTAQQVLLDTRYFLDLDPVGPWFRAGLGYYISRVDTSGKGKNALIEFNPKTGRAQRHITFPVNSNPTTMLLLPGHPSKAWVALRGSTFDNFKTNAIAVVDFDTWTYSKRDLNTLAGLPAKTLTSLASFQWDTACPSNGGSPCAYALANNFDGTLREGTLLVLGVDTDGNPTLIDTVALGRNPQEDMLLDAAGRVWVVNNGGYPPQHTAGNLQALDTSTWADAAVVPEQLESGVSALVGIQPFDNAAAWVTTYPSDVVYSLGLSTPFTLDPNPGLPTLTGPLFHTTAPVAALYAGKGGFGQARLAELNPASGALLATYDLQSGNGPVSCAETTVP